MRYIESDMRSERGNHVMWECPGCGRVVRLDDGDVLPIRCGCGHVQHELPDDLDWLPDMTSRGLGDTVAKATNAIGIKPCGGCKKRQKMMNRLFPYRTNS